MGIIIPYVSFFQVFHKRQYDFGLYFGANFDIIAIQALSDPFDPREAIPGSGGAWIAVAPIAST
jgi:hypothetical protein